MSIKENLQAAAVVAIKDRNFVNHFLTFRQQRGEKISDPDVMAVAGEILSIAWRKALKKGASLEKYTEACIKRLSSKVADDEFETLLRHMYFSDDAKGLFQVSPEFMLFKAGNASSGNTRHVGTVLGNMLLSRPEVKPGKPENLNFLEAELLAEFQSFSSGFSTACATEDYLPFMGDVFAKDLALLCCYPSYMMQNLKAFVGLYNFLYSAQLAMNLRSWRTEPASKPLYFIMDTERASNERTYVREALSSLLDYVEDLFPVLSALEYFNQPDNKEAKRYPLWKHYQYIKALSGEELDELNSGLKIFLESYRSTRGRGSWKGDLNTSEDIFKAITKTATEIFSQPRSSQLTVNRKVVASFETEIARHFIQNRKRGGRVLIMNQDYLLLLTNLAVGARDKLQYQQLIKEFKHRGVWFDQQSQQALIEFYERVGNLERMSDSGDAVYVRKTI
ncbi:DNA phosphorothioation-dependent restriction protein DptG [Bacterioplanoides sp. SCSIO 12839]|uniref:DNA phosphorothioation-dependent restriction protein DptG n=1 Tax=Bacterioplanoides sp. SCSIO 12839 TaxID=2829569 RepID=UPI002102A258|nr:DNA phosphorothioation-dependent restriction protein DptG [Bacterioplanoides sp. SCSIO 12839]UTW49821.1 DNA phosphorothioation-dependent restriction protein DptG [Bacterioplanoides sp. SCSIO 12839]